MNDATTPSAAPWFSAVLNSNTRVEFVEDRMLLVTPIIVTSVLVAALRPARCPSPAGDGAATEGCACSACLEQEAAPPVTQTRLGQLPQHTVFRSQRRRPPGALSGVDVLRCPCGGRRRIIAIHSTRKAAEERLTQLGHHLTPRRLLPPATVQPALPLAG